MQQPSFRIYHPERRTSSVVFAAPHSGRDYCDELMSRSSLDAHLIRSSEDAFVDQLFETVSHTGCPLLVANKPRAYLDLNRGTEELDPALISDLEKRNLNPRISSGLGVVPRVVANGRAIYEGKLSRAEVDKRINRHWHPYHNALQGLLDSSRAEFGHSVLVDLHSMPHEAIESTARSRVPFPEIVLGDRFGAACGSDVILKIEAAFKRVGFRVARNTPFAGAYITQRYGRPSRNQHAVQVEIDRSLYMDETTIRPNADFEHIQKRLVIAAQEIADIGRRSVRLAAE